MYSLEKLENKTYTKKKYCQEGQVGDSLVPREDWQASYKCSGVKRKLERQQIAY